MACCKKCRTEGLLVSTFNCGIVVSYREFFTKESISQVTNFYLDAIKRMQKVPSFLIYDDGCHLKAFIEKKNYFSGTSQHHVLLETTFAVDRFHFKGIAIYDLISRKMINAIFCLTGHSKSHEFCRKKCDPNIFPALYQTNTVVSEQINYWLSKYKYNLKHMNFERFHWYLYIVFSIFNCEKLKINFMN
jgi:hypothetical protein